MKRIELLFSALLLPVDFVMVVLAGLTAYALRVGTTVTDIRPVLYDLQLSSFLPALLFTAGGFVVIFAISGLYAIRGNKRFLDEVTGVFLGCSTSIMAIIVVFFFQRELFSSRFIVLTGWVLAILYITIGRFLVRTIQHALLARSIGLYRVVLVGGSGATTRIAEVLRERPTIGYHVIAQFTDAGPETLRALATLYDHGELDLLFQADPTLPKEHTAALLDFANDHHMSFKYAADLFEAKASHIAIETLAGIPVIEIQRTRLQGWGRILKRGFDVIVSVLVLILTSPIFFLVPLFIRTDSEGPTLVRLERVGEGGKRFFLYKFRSMVKNAAAMKEQLMMQNERNGPLFKMKNDPRVTRVGRFLRITSIDELPQLMNVLKGEMSLVGPRPHEPSEVERYQRHHRRLLEIRPGITGLAQISGRSDLDFEDEARLDIYYIERWSITLDLSILLKTPAVVLRMKSAA